MELVYLWVEEYKNIKQQGFNFSPRFTCRYENGELTIEEKKDYISIFPENINATAIVGGNGSGKSSILSFIFQNIRKNIKIFNESNIFILSLKKKLYILTALSISNIISAQKYEKLELRSPYENGSESNICEITKSFFLGLYHYTMDSNFDFTDWSDAYFPSKESSIKGILKNRLLNIIYFLEGENSKKHRIFFSDYFFPNKILISETPSSREWDVKADYGNLHRLEKELTEAIDIVVFIVYKYLSNQLCKNLLNESCEELKKVDSLTTYREKIVEYCQKCSNDERGDYIKKEVEEAIEWTDGVLKTSMHFNGLGDITNPSLVRKFEIENSRLNKDDFDLFKNLPLCFEVDFYDESKSLKYQDLSTGEKQALDISFRIIRVIESNAKLNNFLFLLDEPTSEMHPEWARKILNYLIKCFEKHNVYIHFVLTSHSPFILSDLPKENVIFLKKGAQVYPDIQTFGANIHTLLSHGFFMEDGLMGEFAKGKIDEVIHFLDGKKSSIKDTDEAQKYISIIGEPILKRQLQKMLDSKKLDKLQEIDVLKTQIETLKNRLDILANNA